jgi:exodeoxyribonuclease-3
MRRLDGRGSQPLRPRFQLPIAERFASAARGVESWLSRHVSQRELHRVLDRFADAMPAETSDETQAWLIASRARLAADLENLQPNKPARDGCTRAVHPDVPREGDRPAMQSTTLRAGSYNLLDGGGARLSAQLEILRALELDLVALQEVTEGDKDDHALECSIANGLGMQSHLALSASHECHLMIAWNPEKLRRVGYTSDAAEGKLHHGLQRMEFTVVATGRRLVVLNTHLAPFSGDVRANEARWLTEYAAPGRTTLLLGDLNTIGSHDPEPDWGSLPLHLHSRHRLCRDDGTFGPTDRRAIRQLIEAGFTEPFADLPNGRHTVGHWSDEDTIHRRSDFILGAGVTFRAAGVVDTSDARRASDHLPPYVVIDAPSDYHPPVLPPPAPAG